MVAPAFYSVGTNVLASPLVGTERVTVDNGGPTIATATASQIAAVGFTRSTAQLDKTASTVLANVTGLSQAVLAGTYFFEINLTGTAGASGGWKVAFNYTGATLSALNATGFAFTASAVAVAATTTTTTQASIIASTAANIGGRITGTMVVTAAGTVQLQFAQNVSDGTACSIYVGSTMWFVKIA